MISEDSKSLFAEEEPGLDMGAMSKRLAELWKAATEDEKEPYNVSPYKSHDLESMHAADCIRTVTIVINTHPVDSMQILVEAIPSICGAIFSRHPP